jgi:hypothetical protein
MVKPLPVEAGKPIKKRIEDCFSFDLATHEIRYIGTGDCFTYNEFADWLNKVFPVSKIPPFRSHHHKQTRR